jgi:hypothetical protein
VGRTALARHQGRLGEENPVEIPVGNVREGAGAFTKRTEGGGGKAGFCLPLLAALDLFTRSRCLAVFASCEHEVEEVEVEDLPALPDIGLASFTRR